MKKLLILLLALSMILLLAACGDEDTAESDDASVSNGASATDDTSASGDTSASKYAADEVITADTDTEWAIYWYLCGSDLETNYGAATSDLFEMMEVELPENVTVVIQTGGSAVWQNDFVDAECLQRYIYTYQGLELAEELPSAGMGEAQTLEDFLAFAKQNYPAKRTAVIMWNHGGGSVAGAAFDELYGMDSLSLDEMYEAFLGAFGENPGNQPIDIIGFDTCLMATVDVVFTFSDIGKYLVASQEVEPGNGWFYSGWMNRIADNPAIEAPELAAAICDTYVEGCELEGTEDNITLSATNLSKVSRLIAAYDDFGKEALAAAIENPAFFAYFSKIANSIENYGGNTREQGFTNMADLGHMAAKSSMLLPVTSANVIAALEDCVEYKVNGKYRPDSSGLSCYYSYNGDLDDFSAYTQIGPADSFKYFYAYGLTGGLSQQGMDYIAEMNYDSLPQLMTLANMDWDNMPVTVDEAGCATLTLGSEANDILSSLTFELYYADPEEDIMLCLGTDNDIIADWDNGIFKDNFRGVWGSLDGALCYMEIAYEGEDYNLYSVPILLNGEEYNLMVIYDFSTAQYIIEGARKSLDESGAADKNLRYLAADDEIQTIHYAATISGESDELMAVPIDTIIVTPEITFAETELGDGLFIMMYAMCDSQGNEAYSAPAYFEVSLGEIITSVD